jgi:7-cyano-7-deazaguanine synthase in queuosine biosynthesis
MDAVTWDGDAIVIGGTRIDRADYVDEPSKYVEAMYAAVDAMERRDLEIAAEFEQKRAEGLAEKLVAAGIGPKTK